MKKSKGGRTCKNKHSIDRNMVILLGKLVGYCPCGHKYIHSEIPVVYAYDKHNPIGERFHHYSFLTMLMCGKCHTILSGVDIACHPLSELDVTWEVALEEFLNAPKEKVAE